MTSKRILITFTLAVMTAFSTVTLHAQTVETTAENSDRLAQTAAQGGGLLDTLERMKEIQAQQLEGSWAIVVTPVVPSGVPQPPSFRTYLTNSRGGASTGSDRNRPFGSPQHGTWAHMGGNEFAATHIQDLFDMLGNFQGTLKVRQRITLIGKDEFVGVATAETRDATGAIVSTRCATTRGERIVIEPLAPQCQSITPPQ